jgi:D-lactate dehydrogenase
LKLGFFEVQEWEAPLLQQKLTGNEVKFNKETLTEANVESVKDFDAISVFIYSKLDSTMIDKLEKTRLIATRSTGFEHIDLEACRRRGITVCNVPAYGEETVAEHTFALLLSLSRMINDSYERTRQGDFECGGVPGFDLNGKVLGVLGTGRIGTKVIEIAHGFRMEVLAYDKFPNVNLADALGFTYVDWPELLKRSDVVTLHLPLNKETYHFLNKDTINSMKQGAVVINTARGALIDTQALTEALQNGHLRGAGLDVLEEETLIREEAQLLLDNMPREQLATMLRTHILLRLRNVVITPHCAFNSKESLERLVNGTIDNIEAFAAGKPQNIVK